MRNRRVVCWTGSSDTLISPLLWRSVKPRLSAGRVQSVAVRLICEREAEIEAFKPEEYWTLTATLTPTEVEHPFPSKAT